MTDEKPTADEVQHARNAVLRKIAVPVRMQDVVGFAKRTCRTCNSTGHYYVRGRDETCGCALRRYVKRQNCVLSRDGRLLAMPPYDHVSEETLEQFKAALAAEEQPIQSGTGAGDGAAARETTEAG